MTRSLEQIVHIGEALAHPVRIQLLYLLSEKERYIYELAKDLNLSRQVVDLHLKRLEKAGFVESDLRLEENDLRAKILQAERVRCETLYRRPEEHIQLIGFKESGSRL